MSNPDSTETDDDMQAADHLLSRMAQWDGNAPLRGQMNEIDSGDLPDGDLQDDLPSAQLGEEQSALEAQLQAIAGGELRGANADAVLQTLPAEERALYRPVDAMVRQRVIKQSQNAIAAPADPHTQSRRNVRIVGALATAAAAVLFMTVQATAPNLPPYGIEISAGAAELRSTTDEESHRYRPSDRLEIVLRPAEAVDGEVAVAAFDGDLAWTPDFDISPSGSVRVAGEAGELLSEPGAHTLMFVVDRAENLPRSRSEIDDARALIVNVTLLQ